MPFLPSLYNNRHLTVIAVQTRAICIYPLLTVFFPRAHLLDAAIAVRVELLAEVEAYPVAVRYIVLIEIIVFLLESVR